MANITGLLWTPASPILVPSIDLTINTVFFTRGAYTGKPLRKGEGETISHQIIPYLTEAIYNQDDSLILDILEQKFRNVVVTINEIEKVDNAFNFNNLLYEKIKTEIENTFGGTVESIEK